ncbi:hypothetical protein ACTI_38650 [Actinoplanes sp. OR16]|nr:hypothetical protein ACTI_38650 [Actinoplanes sp. OR16]
MGRLQTLERQRGRGQGIDLTDLGAAARGRQDGGAAARRGQDGGRAEERRERELAGAGAAREGWEGYLAVSDTAWAKTSERCSKLRKRP